MTTCPYPIGLSYARGAPSMFIRGWASPSIKLVMLGALLPFVAIAQDFKESRSVYIECGGLSEVKLTASTRDSTVTSKVKCGSEVTIVEVATSGWYRIRAKDGASGYVSRSLLSPSKPMETGLLAQSGTEGASQPTEPLPLKSWVGEVSVWTPETFEPGELQTCLTSPVSERFLLCGQKGFDQFFHMADACIIKTDMAVVLADKGAKLDDKESETRALAIMIMCDAQSLEGMKKAHGKTFIVSFDRTPWPESKSESRAEWKCTKEKSISCASVSYLVLSATQDSSLHP